MEVTYRSRSFLIQMVKLLIPDRAFPLNEGEILEKKRKEPQLGFCLPPCPSCLPYLRNEVSQFAEGAVLPPFVPAFLLRGASMKRKSRDTHKKLQPSKRVNFLGYDNITSLHINIPLKTVKEQGTITQPF